MMNKM